MEMERFSNNLPPFTNEIENPDIQDSLTSLKKLSNKKINILDWGNNRIAVPLELKIDLPSLGNFEDLDIRETEPVIIVFDIKNYPVSAPKVFTDRLDFPKNNLAHLYIASNNRPPAFCYVRGNTDEWYANKRIDDLVVRIGNWLRDAATGELTTNGEQYEPLRLEGYSGSMIYDYDTILNELITNQDIQIGERSASVLFTSSHKDEDYTYHFSKFITNENGDTILKNVNEEREKFKENDKGKQYFYSILLWNDETEINEDYEVNIPSSWEEFKSFCAFYKINYDVFEKFASAFTYINEDKYFPLIIGIRRPRQLIGYSSNMEFINLCVKLSQDDVKEDKIISNVAIKMLEHNQPLTQKLASKISGADKGYDASSVIFGCGALGSKVILHLAKSGNTNLTLIDPDHLSPHNLVRHSLFADDIGKNKSKALVDKIKALFPFEQTAILGGPSFKEGYLEKEDTFKNHEWIMDFTASNSFFNKLSTLENINNCSIIIASISDFGNLGILYKEGRLRNPRMDDLQVCLYSESEKDIEIENWLCNEKAAENSNNLLVSVGIGCNSESTVLSDDKISSHASYFSGAIKKEMSNKSEIGKIFLNKISDDPEYKIESKVLYVNPFEIYQMTNNSKWTVRFRDNVTVQMKNAFRASGTFETGGVFLGICNYKTKTIYVSGIINAPPDSKSNRAEFIRGREGLAEEISEIERKSGGQIGYIGEWHTHPEDPDGLSFQDMRSISRHKEELSQLIPPLPVFICLVTPNGLFPYIF
jgi:integrative and conjugative element protein (TIGR02256 family)